MTSWRSHNRAWQPRRHDRLSETSGTPWSHRGALTNQRCSLATGCGIITFTGTCVYPVLLISIRQADGRLTVRFREASKPRDSCLDFSNRSEIWQAPRKQRCRDACQILVRCDHYNNQSGGFEISGDLTVRRPSAYWIETLVLWIATCIALKYSQKEKKRIKRQKVE